MAKEVVTRLVCDIGERHDGSQTLTYEVSGQGYELDLCDKHADQFDKDLKKWVEASAKTASNRKRTSKVRAAQTSGVDYAAVRRWAGIKGIQVAARGNVPKSVIEQWQKDGAPTG